MTNTASHMLFTGDIGPARAQPSSILRLCSDRLQGADLLAGQLEPVLSNRGDKAPQARLAMRTAPESAIALANAGFRVISFASNHCMDWGTAGLLDTIDTLHGANIQLIGAARNIRGAQEPAVITVDGTRIALLAVNSILPAGYAAEPERAGCAPMHGWTLYEQIEHDQPGTPSRTHSFANRDHLAQLCSNISAAKNAADVVVLSIHWGIHFVPAVIAEYQREVAHAAIDAGADVIIGHHPHVLKGIEVYRGKVIFYSLGNFAIDPPTAFDKSIRGTRAHKEIADLNPAWEDDAGHISLPDSAMAIVARCDVSLGRMQRVCALPVYINRQSQPEFVPASDSRFDKIAAYLSAITRSESLNGSFVIDDNELVIDCAN